ncbi:MAG: hypothetical protein CME32_18640 [Gimesia sp.]|nr:hypothetical protein [Gimesia sp.]
MMKKSYHTQKNTDGGNKHLQFRRQQLAQMLGKLLARIWLEKRHRCTVDQEHPHNAKQTEEVTDLIH